MGDAVPNPTTGIKPSRRVREAPGGKGSLGKAFWGDEAEPAQETFKPSRRCVPRRQRVSQTLTVPFHSVRENPGGTGHGPVSALVVTSHHISDLPKLTRSPALLRT
jgi:hypothetical protein